VRVAQIDHDTEGIPRNEYIIDLVGFLHCVGFLLGFSYAQKYMNQKNGRKSCKNNPYPGFLPDRGLV
jgi:hypothetical protein